MAILDTSPLHAPTAPSGTERGMRMLTDVLDAIAQRRQQKQLADQQLAAQQAQNEAAMQFNQQKLEQDARFKAEDDRRSEQVRQDQAAQMQAQRDREMGKTRGEAMEKAFGMAKEGNAANVPAYLRSIDPAASIAPKTLPQPDTTDTPDDPIAAMDEIQGSVQQRQAFNDKNRDVYTMKLGGQDTDLNLQGLTPEARAQMIASTFGLDSPEYAASQRASKYAGANMIKPGTEASVVEADARDKAAMERARVSAAAARERKAAGDPYKDAAAVDRRFGKFLEQQSYRANLLTRDKFGQMQEVAKEAAQGNPAAAAAFMGMYVKFAQGEVGVLTESDLNTFWRNAGSPKDRSEAALQKIIDGTNGPAQQAAAVKAIAVLEAKVRSKLDATWKQSAEILRPYGDDGESLSRAYFGRGFPEGEKAKADAVIDDFLKEGGAK